MKRATRIVCMGTYGIAVPLSIAIGLFLLCARSTGFQAAILRFTTQPSEMAEQVKVRSSVMDYLWRNIPLPTDLFSEREIIHMNDVAGIMRILELIEVVLFTIIAFIMFMARRFRLSLKALSKRMSVVSSLLVIVFALVTVSMFGPAFNRLHTFLFRNDLWLLDPQLHALIRVYTEGFFVLFSVWYFIFLLLIFATMYLVLSWKNERAQFGRGSKANGIL